MLINASTTMYSLQHTSSPTEKDNMYNDAIDLTVTCGMLFKKCEIENGKALVSRVTDCLWTIDTNHSSINKAFIEKSAKGCRRFLMEFMEKNITIAKQKKVKSTIVIGKDESKQ